MYRKTDRKRNYQYIFSYIDVEVNPKRHIPSGTRFIDAYDVNDFKERLSKLFTKALKRGLPEQIIPEHIFSQVENLAPTDPLFGVSVSVTDIDWKTYA